MLRDLRYALRLIARSPLFCAAAILTFALGIGANTAIFSVANALLLRQLPYPHPDRLVVLNLERKSADERDSPLSLPRFTFIADHSQSLAGPAAFTNEVFSLTGHGDPEQVRAERVTWNFFDTLGVAPAFGRSFRPEEDQPGGDAVVLISHALAMRLFGADAAASGGHLALDSRDYTIIGVLPPDFSFGLFGEAADIVAPRVYDLNIITPQQARNGTGFLTGIARLKPGIAISQAQAELDALGADYRRDNPKLPDADPGATVSISNLRDEMVRNFRSAVLILFGAVTLVLLIACANVAGLLLSRAMGRQREIAVRAAIGATRRELVRQLLTESLVLALAGGALGAAGSAWGTRVLASLAGQILPRAAEIHTDTRVLVFTLAVSILAGILFGLAPALQLARPDPGAGLRTQGRGSTSGRGRIALRSVLVVSQVTLAIVLLIGAGLLLRNFVQILSAGAGFDTRNVLTMKVALPPSRYVGGAKMTAFYDELVRSVRTVPGVIAVADSSALPANPIRYSPALAEGQPAVPLGERPLFNIQTISPGYAATLRLPLLRGREFRENDDATAPRVIVVNETLVRRFWPNQNPIGKHILLGRMTQPCEVVGVFGDIRNNSLAADVQPEIYLPFAQLPWPAMHLLVRTAGAPQGFVASVRARIRELDRDLPVTGVQTMEELLESAAAQPRFTTSLLGALAATALLLAIVGIYGVIAYSVAERTREMGIRLALGAERTDILRLVLRQGLLLAFGGIGLGLGGAFLLTRLMQSLLYRVSTTDPLTFVAGPLLFLFVAMAASYIPARRATRVDPVIALQYE